MEKGHLTSLIGTAGDRLHDPPEGPRLTCQTQGEDPVSSLLLNKALEACHSHSAKNYVSF